ncbi:MAG: hypothetical protein FJ254_01710 [Phycisphaerae bacterium]|nr:hypothetical protein [Phycisphaerae bacterium]
MKTTAILSFIALIASGLAFRAPEATSKGSPYCLTTCAVSGEPLGKDTVTIVVEDASSKINDGREIKVCCSKCAKKFKSDQATFLKKVDEAMITEQLKWYPDGSCMVMPDDKLPDPRGADAMEAKNIVVRNQLVRLCCGKCVKKVRADPDTWVTKVVAQVVAAQKPGYPLDTCVISGEKLGDDAVDTVIGSRLVRTCCDKCAAKAKADPIAAFAKLDAAKK